MPDTFSSVASRVSRGWWNLVADYAQTTGIGLILAFIALWYGEYVSWLFAVLVIGGSLVLLWRAAAYRLRWRKWLRSSDDDL